MPRSLVRRSMRAAPLVLAGILAGCGTGGPPDWVASGPEASASPVAVASQTAALASGDPTPVPSAAGSKPPAAFLSGGTLPGEAAAGDLGSYTWGEEGSDAPWIVSAPGVLAHPATPVGVTFDPSVASPAWTVRWAPITAGAAGDVAFASRGSGEIAFAVPDQAGPWSLQLEARFGTGHGATWYWRVDVA